jgi:hypothetical protein
MLVGCRAVFVACVGCDTGPERVCSGRADRVHVEVWLTAPRFVEVLSSKHEEI